MDTFMTYTLEFDQGISRKGFPDWTNRTDRESICACPLVYDLRQRLKVVQFSSELLVYSLPRRHLASPLKIIRKSHLEGGAPRGNLSDDNKNSNIEQLWPAPNSELETKQKHQPLNPGTHLAY